LPLGDNIKNQQGLVRLTERNFNQVFSNFSKFLFFIARPRKFRKGVYTPLIDHTIKELFLLFKVLGDRRFVAYLKACNHAVYSFIGGKPLHQTDGLGISVKLRNGLPAVLHPALRSAIRRGDRKIILIVVSLFHSSKSILVDPLITKGVGLPTIGAPSGKPEFEASEIMFENFLDKCFLSSMTFSIKKYSEHHYHPTPIFSSGPNSTISSLGFTKDLVALKRHGLLNTVFRYAELTGHDGILDLIKENYLPEGKFEPLTDICQAPFTYDGLHVEENWCPYPEEISAIEDDTERLQARIKFLADYMGPQVGKLSIKVEGGAKLRVFAILDSISQWLLKPLHDCIFDILKNIPSDATFDQDGVLEEFIKTNKGKTFWSYDLKGATDMIPKEFYVSVLALIIGQEAASLWSKLFDRNFLAPKSMWLGKLAPFWMRYTRGQPMGAYSSWACLALLHHVIVAYAHYRSTRSLDLPVGKYLVLGDDITFSDKLLAESYLQVCKEFGIPISLVKSYPESRVCNFANQTYTSEGVNLSPISMREVLQAHTFSRRLELAHRLVKRGYIEEGLSNLYRCFFSHRSWELEAPLLTRGTYSPFGKQVLRTLFQPSGRNNLDIQDGIAGFYPTASMLSHTKVHEELDTNVLTALPRSPDKKVSHQVYLLEMLHSKLSQRLLEYYTKCDKLISDLNPLVNEISHALRRKSHAIPYVFSPESLDKVYSKIKRVELGGQNTAYLVQVLDRNDPKQRIGGFWSPLLLGYRDLVIRSQEMLKQKSISWGYKADGTYSVTKYLTDFVMEMYSTPPVLDLRYGANWAKAGALQQYQNQGNYISPGLPQFEKDIRKLFVVTGILASSWKVDPFIKLGPPPKMRQDKKKAFRKKRGILVK